MVEGVYCSECYVASNECDEPTCCLVRPIGAHGGEVMYFWSFCCRGELDFLNCDAICVCVVNKQFEFLEFILNSVHVDLKIKFIALSLLELRACVVYVLMWSSLVCL